MSSVCDFQIELLETFGASLIPATAVQAREKIVTFASKPGFLASTLLLANDENVFEQIRIASAIQFKNTVLDRWVVKCPEKQLSSQPIDDSEKTLVKSRILSLLFTPSVPIRNQIEDAIQAIVSTDYPKSWPDLHQFVIESLKTKDKLRVLGGLIVLHIILSRYGYDSSDMRRCIDGFMVQVCPLFSGLLDMLMQSSGASADLMEIQYWITKCLRNYFFVGIPEYYCEESIMDKVMEFLISIFSFYIPDNFPAYYWKNKHSIVSLFTSLTHHYDTTVFVEKSSHSEKQFSKLWLCKYASKFLVKCLDFLKLYSLHRNMPPKFLSYILDYVNCAIDIECLWVLISPHVLDLLTAVVLPILSLTESEIEMFDSEPREWLIQNYDLPVFNPRYSSTQLIHQVVLKQRKYWLNEITNWIFKSIFGSLENATFSQEKTALKHAFLLIFKKLHKSYIDDPEYESFTNQVLRYHVFPELKGVPIMQNKACSVLKNFISSITSEEFKLEILHAFLDLGLNSPNLAVASEALVALNDFLKMENMRGALEPFVAELAFRCLKLVELTGLDRVMNSLQTMIKIFPETINTYTLQVIDTLVREFNNSYALYISKDLHKLQFEDLIFEPNYSVLNQILNSIAVFYRAAVCSPKVFLQLEPLIIPVLFHPFTNENLHFLQPTMSILEEITARTPVPLSQELWKLFDAAIYAYVNWDLDFSTEFLNVLSNFIARDRSEFLKNDTRLTAVFNMIKHSFSPNMSEYNTAFVTLILHVLFSSYAGYVDQLIQPVLRLVVYRLRYPCSVPLQVTLVEVFLYALCYNMELTLNTLDCGTASGFINLTLQLISSGSLSRVSDMKIAILGFCKLLSLPYEYLPSYAQEKYREIWMSVLHLLGMIDTESANDEEEDEEDDDYLSSIQSANEDDDDDDFENNFLHSEDFTKAMTFFSNSEWQSFTSFSDLLKEEPYLGPKYTLWSLNFLPKPPNLPTDKINHKLTVNETIARLSNSQETLKKFFTIEEINRYFI